VNPLLALAMVVIGGLLLAAAVIVYVLGGLAAGPAIALGVVGLLVDTAGALMLVAARRGSAGSRRP
jgi:hypothetical protein